MSYGVIGLAALLLDWATFVALTTAGMATIPGNLFGRIAGAGLGFWFNGTVTFRDVEGHRAGWPQMRRFLLVWVSIAAISTFSMYNIDKQLDLRWAWTTKPFIDAVLAGISFMLSRYWIYNK